MIRSFIFSKGRMISRDVTLDFLKVALYDENVQIWVDAEKATPEETRNLLEGVFGFHPLAIEDCVTPSERPKIDEYENYVFMCIHRIDFSEVKHEFESRELNVFIGKDFLVTYHDDPLPSITAAVDRCARNPTTVARATDKLIYAILDLLLDGYGPALDKLSARIAAIEKAILMSPTSDALSDILDLKAEVQRLRQIVAPQCEVIGRLARGEFKVVRATMLPYYRDLLDRLHRIADQTETFRDALTGILQVQLNLQQKHMNRVVTIQTILATLAIPILVVTSWYGMNLRHWPTPQASTGASYFWIFGLTVTLTLVTYLLLRTRRWM
ncbi:MAG: magnesium transporter CorA family protein [Lentisphaerae bacterium]|nr:magnesium transporter CorA family protein [Lentisphaerota bacterium]